MRRHQVARAERLAAGCCASGEWRTSDADAAHQFGVRSRDDSRATSIDAFLSPVPSLLSLFRLSRILLWGTQLDGAFFSGFRSRHLLHFHSCPTSLGTTRAKESRGCAKEEHRGRGRKERVVKREYVITSEVGQCGQGDRNRHPASCSAESSGGTVRPGSSARGRGTRKILRSS